MSDRVLKRIKPTTRIFLVMLGVTLALWLLRGIGLLGFMPGGILWILIFTCLVLAILTTIR